MKRRWIIAAGVAGVAALGGAAAANNVRAPTTQVAPASLTERLVARAEVVSTEGVAEVRARIDGRVTRVLVREGDHVEAGQLLAELEGESQQAEVSRRQAERSALDANAAAVAAPARPEDRALAEAEAAAARREYELARDRAARAERLRGSGAGAEAEASATTSLAAVALERVHMAEARVRMATRGGRDVDVRAARARVEAASASVELAQRDLARTRIVAPIAGSVLARRIDPGDSVSLPATEALFDIADPTRVEVRAEIEELDAPRVSVGMPVYVTLVGRDERLAEGAVARISPRLERRRVGVEDVRVRADGVVRMAWISLSNRANLAIGQRLDAHLSFAAREVATTLPREAVRVVDGRALVQTPAYAGLWYEDRAVTLGVADARRVEVRGLSPGAVVRLRERVTD
jgi:multidrug resistance efflux pump